MDIQEALTYLAGLTRFGVNLGLGRIEELLRRLGRPHKDLKIVHIGGTNGKGSTAVMLANILQSAGYRTGLFTSPHLHSYCERFQINGQEINQETLAGLISELRPHLEAMAAEGFEHPTEFEVVTALAMVYFYREKVDFLVLEVGMGGAIDSTNVVTPLLAVITNVSVDHSGYLGSTVEEIAAVKSGIIKPGVPAVTAAAGDALAVIATACREKGSPLIIVGRDLTWKHQDASVSGQCFSVRGRRYHLDNLWLPLLGRHQQINAVTAIAAAEILVDRGFTVGERAVRDGLARTRWPARLEILRWEPLVLVDGAHNFDGARSLRRALEDYFPGRGKIMVLGLLADKEREKVVSELAPAARAVVVTRPDSPRAGHWQDLAADVRRYTTEVYLIENVEEAVHKALGLVRTGEMVFVAGSLYLAAEAREVLLRA